MNRFFGNFDLNSRGILTNIRSLGSGHNGFIKILTFSKLGFDAFATLKFNRARDADNLLYEYRVGQYINTIMHKFPCFVQTYNVFRITPQGYTDLKNSSLDPANHAEPTPDELSNMLTPMPSDDITDGCISPLRICLLTQFFPNCPSLHGWLLDEFTTPHDVYANLVQILYQVYYVMHKLRHRFTHYDLHPGNVLLYPAPDVAGQPGHFYFRYFTPEGDVDFRCRYLVKIIDYGRCFYFNTPTDNSQQHFWAVRASQKCNSPPPSVVECGTNDGFHRLRPGCTDPEYFFGISSDRKNETHDLRLIDNTLWGIFGQPHKSIFRAKYFNALRAISPSFHDLLFRMARKIKYINSPTGELPHEDTAGLGAPEKLHCSAAQPICNMEGAERTLRTALVRNSYELINELNAQYNPALLFATIVCNGHDAVQFIRS
jgi:hypothetical protein